MSVTLTADKREAITQALKEERFGDLPEARQGFEALTHIVEHGIPVKNFYDKSPDNDAVSYGFDALTLQKYGDRFKAFIRGRFLCLDIDRKPADIAKDPEHGDGLRNFEVFLDRIGKLRNMRPHELRDIEGGSFPCFVTTPSGGLHLYFRYAGLPAAGILTTHVEVKTWTITAPGSFKDGRPYVLYGNISDVPPLPKFLNDRLPKTKQVTLAPRFIPLGKTKFDGATTWEKIVEFTDKDGQGTGGRNEWAYSTALHAKTHNWNKADTLEALRNEPRISGLPDQEIINTVDSAYRGKT
jgi:hypothetical protein